MPNWASRDARTELKPAKVAEANAGAGAGDPSYLLSVRRFLRNDPCFSARLALIFSIQYLDMYGKIVYFLRCAKMHNILLFREQIIMQLLFSIQKTTTAWKFRAQLIKVNQFPWQTSYSE